MISVAKILELLPSEGNLEIKKLEKMLKLTRKAERIQLEIGLNALAKIGIVEKSEDHKVKPSPTSSAIKGFVRCSSKGFCFVVRDNGEDDIYIRDQYLNHAWHGDHVLVRITRDGLKRRSPEGAILCILERSNHRLLASIQEDNGNFIATPLDERILGKINVDVSNLDKKILNDSTNIYEIQLTSFPIAQHNAKGNILKTFNLKAGFQGDVDIIKAKNKVPDKNQTSRVSLKAPITKNRVDLTNQDVLLLNSWEIRNKPPLLGLYAEPFSGGVKLWVHVPTVSERINLGSKLDQNIQAITESIYTGTDWTNILPKSLIEESSFTSGKTNEAITLEIEVSKEGAYKDWKFYLSTIKPKAIINNQHLEALKNKKPRSRTIPSKLKSIKDYLTQLSTLIHAVSILDQNITSDYYINLSDKNNNISTLSDLNYINPGVSYQSWKYPLDDTDCNSLVNVVSRVSNIIWNKHHKSLNLPSISLSHQSLDSNTLTEIIKSAVILGTKIELNDLGEISLLELLNSISEPQNQKIIEKSIKSSLPQKSFFHNYSQDTHQPNENTDDQTELLEESPWTSPSISYCDIINQNVLVMMLTEARNKASSKSKDLANLGYKDISSSITWDLFTPTQFKSFDQYINPRICRLLNNAAKRTKLFIADFISILETREIQSNIQQAHEGIITGVQSYGFFVELFPYSSEGLVHVSTLDDDWYEYRSRQNMLIGRKSKKTYQLGDIVRVNILKVDVLKGQVDLEILSDNNVSSVINSSINEHSSSEI